MNYFYEAEIKQVIALNGNWEVIYNPGTVDEFCVDVVYFAICDLMAKPYLDKHGREYELGKDDNCLGVILPVVFDDEEGLAVEILSYYESPKIKQETRLRRRENETHIIC